MAGTEHGDTFAEIVAKETARAAGRQRRSAEERAAIGVKQTIDELQRMDPVKMLDVDDDDMLDLAQRAVRLGLATGPADIIEDAGTVIRVYRVDHGLD